MGIGDLSKLQSFIPYSKSGITLDDGFDQMNRVIMFALLCICGTLVSVRNYMGNVIKCYGFNTFSDGFAEDYCWTQGIYTLRHAYGDTSGQLPYPGLLPEEAMGCYPGIRLRSGGLIECPDPDTVLPPERVFHLWYQWITVYFFLGACAFRAPYMLYKLIGLGEVKNLALLINYSLNDAAVNEKGIEKVSSWLFYKFKLLYNPPSLYARVIGRNRLIGITFITKLIYIFVSLGFFLITDHMFQIGSFITYGKDWIEANNSTEAALVRDTLLPKMVACEIKRWGATGLEEEQGMCVLAPNVINAYLFLIVWFATIIVIATNILSIIVYTATTMCPSVMYDKFCTTALLSPSKSRKGLYLQIGPSGRMLLTILANNCVPRFLEEVLNRVIDRAKIDRFNEPVDIMQSDV